ncbi:MAG: hypothetical protein LUM44_01950 [Pyrinomonadaceae bacterium]|nr:hypothetical protein [Pyrinomonadaceae bacterium]
MSENKRKNHPEFTKYQELIANHQVYQGLHFSRNRSGSVRWVVTGKSEEGRQRKKWWVAKCKELGIKVEAGAFAKAAVALHPTKIHICQICGKGLSVEYVYPNKNLINKLKLAFQVEYKAFDKDIFQIIDELSTNEEALKKLKVIFKSTDEIENTEMLKDWLNENHTKKSSKSFLSPGVMSNPPDRFDGFHSDGSCCRSESDKGRHKENLQRYGQDRRVYENWADGDWKQADRLMSEFRKVGLSADHIGPISLGFCHRPKFHALTKEKNSAKNNRMSLSDVRILIADENNGEQVVSWHSKYIWDSLKNYVQNDPDAVKLSTLMRTNLHYVLTLFSIIDELGFREFLMQFLNLKYSFFDYKFEGFDPQTGKFKTLTRIEKRGKNQDNNTKRYVRIAFESLEEYKSITNRKVNLWNDPEIDVKVNKMLELLKLGEKSEAEIELHEILKEFAKQLTQKW